MPANFDCMGRRPASFDLHIAADAPPQKRQLLMESADEGVKSLIIGSRGQQDADPTHALWLLRARRERPSGRRAADERDDLAPSHKLPSAEDQSLPYRLIRSVLCVTAKSGARLPDWVIFDRSSQLCLPVDVRFAPEAAELLRGTK